MTEYHVTWEIDVEADSPEDAARRARHYQTKEGTTADAFDVADEHGNITPVDLTEIWEERRPILAAQVAALGQWTGDNASAAQKQGWDLFDINDGFSLLIQRIDDMSDVRPSGVGEPVFDSDEEAIAEVRQLAAKGDGLAIKAIAIHDFSVIEKR